MRNVLRNRAARVVGAAAGVLALTGAVITDVGSAGPAGAASHAADKMVVSGTNGLALCSTSVPVSVSPTTACNEGPTAILQGSIKLSTPKNLEVDVTLDCSTVTDVSTSTTSSGGNKNTSSSEAAAGVHAWLTITPAGQTPNPGVGIIAVTPAGPRTPASSTPAT